MALHANASRTNAPDDKAHTIITHFSICGIEDVTEQWKIKQENHQKQRTKERRMRKYAVNSPAALPQTSARSPCSPTLLHCPICIWRRSTGWGSICWRERRSSWAPFRDGRVARIDFGMGVCGTAVREKRTQRVDSTHHCDNHIVCDPASKSEIVVPLERLAGDGGLYGVLDIDSPREARFDDVDREELEMLAAQLSAELRAKGWRNSL